jgi:hypothetical protein
MLQCNEVRLGNYVLIHNKLKKITLINNDSGFKDVPLVGFEGSSDNFIRCDAAELSAVPLTDEVLRQCGFVFHDYFHFWQLLSTGSAVRSEMDIDPDYNLIDFMRRPLVKRISSLHQLQNLFFALKGSELPFDQRQLATANQPNGAAAGAAVV